MNRDSATASILLRCGILAGPMFIVVVLVQDYTRASVDPRVQPLSLLTLGDLGWLQITNFIVAGLLNLACAVGLRQALRHEPAGTWGPLLIGTYGLGLIMAGAFVPDPAFGYPPGAPAGMPTDITWHARLHTGAAILVFGSLIPACLVFARRFALRRTWGWSAYCGVIGVVVAGLVQWTSDPAVTSLALRAAVALGWTWTSVLAAHVLVSR